MPAASAPATNLDIEVTGLRSAKGMIRVCLTADPANFPGCVDDKRAITRSVPANQRDIRIAGLAPGNYAAAVIHDENSNAKLDTFAGIPREGFGFSRNPRIGFGPPRFSAAEFAVGGVAETQQVDDALHALTAAGGAKSHQRALRSGNIPFFVGAALCVLPLT